MLLVLSGMDLDMVILLLEYKAGKDVVGVVSYGSVWVHTTPGVYTR